MRYPRRARRRAPLTLLCLPGAVSAQVVITPVIAPGQPAPGSTGAFNGPQPPACQTAGKVALYAFLIDTPQPGLDNQGIWQATSATQTPVAILSQSVPGLAGRTWSSFDNPTQNRVGGAVFAGGMSAPFTDDRTLSYSAGGAPQIAVREGDGANGIPGALIGDIGVSFPPDYAMNDSARIVFLAPLTGVPGPSSRAIFITEAPTRAYTLVARQQDPAPLPGGPLMTFITAPSINARGDVAFFTNLNTAPFFTLLWKPSGGTLQPAVSAGDPAPGFPPGSVIASLVGQNSGPPQFNDRGEFTVAGDVGPTFPHSFGLWRGAPGALELVARKNDPAVGHPSPNAMFSDFDPLINRRGDVLFSSNLLNGLAQNSGIWIAPAGQGPELLALLGAQAPEMPAGIMLQSITNGGIAFNNRGEGLINASMNYVVNSTPANGIFAGRPGRLRKVVASGDSLEVSPGVFRTPISILCWTRNSPDTGRQVAINDRGEIAFSCNFVGGGGGAFLARLPHPCPGDATGDDVIDFTDLNLVLTFFGMAVPAGTSGDLNGDGVVDFLDLNTVLTFFGGTC